MKVLKILFRILAVITFPLWIIPFIVIAALYAVWEMSGEFWDYAKKRIVAIKQRFKKKA